MQQTSGAVVDLAAYKDRTREAKPADELVHDEREEIIREIAHHLLEAIRAIKLLTH